MAFVFRSDRNLVMEARKNKNLGPGSYLGHTDLRPKYVYTSAPHSCRSNAPFASRSERNFHPTNSYAPGTSLVLKLS